MPFDVFRLRVVVGANITMLGAAGAMFGLFFFMAIYTQAVLGYSALGSGLAQVPLAVTLVVAAVAVSPLVTWCGIRPVLLGGLVLFGGGLVCVRPHPRGRIIRCRHARSVAAPWARSRGDLDPLSVAAVDGVAAKEYGLASGLISTSQQIGGALGLAVLASVATARTKELVDGGEDRIAALTEGFQLGLIVAAGFVALMIVVVAVAGGRGRADRARRSRPSPSPGERSDGAPITTRIGDCRRREVSPYRRSSVRMRASVVIIVEVPGPVTLTREVTGATAPIERQHSVDATNHSHQAHTAANGVGRQQQT